MKIAVAGTGYVGLSLATLLSTKYEIEALDIIPEKVDMINKRISPIKDEYIKLSKNSGACNARNMGIEKATGDFIAFQDSDDVLYKNKLEAQLDNLLKNNYDIGFCKIKVCDGDLKTVIPTEEQEEKFTKKSFLYTICESNFISTQAILAKKEVFDNIKFDINLPRHQDYDLVLRILTKYKVSYTNKVLVNLYRQSDSISSSYKKVRKSLYINVKKEL